MNSWKKTIQVAIYIFCFLSFTKSNATNSNLTTPCDTTAPILIASGPTTFCSGGSVTLSDSQGRILHWSNGADSISITVSTTGHYSAYWTDNNGCYSNNAGVDVTVNEIPTGFTLNYPYQQCDNDSGLVTLSGNTYGHNILWDDNSTGLSVWIKSFQRSVTITNVYGCSKYLISNTYLYYTPPISITGDLDICPGQSSTLSIVNPDPNLNYYWDNGAIGPSITANYASTTTVGVVAWTGGMCGSFGSATVNVHTPNASISGPNSICVGSYAYLYSSSYGNYIWSNGSTSSAINVNPSTTTTYTLTVTDFYGCTAKASKVLQVGQYPIITISGDTTICNRDTAHLSASGASTYQWIDGSTGSNANLYNYTFAYVTGTSSLGCVTSKNFNILIDNSAIPIYSTPGNVVTICSGQSITVSDTNSLINTHLWSTGSTSPSITISPTATTTYSLTTTSLSGCSYASTQTIYVDTPATSVLGASQAVIAGGSTTIYSYVYGTSYLWNTGDTTKYITVSPTVATTYYLNVGFSGGCSANDSITIYVDSLPTLTAPDTVCAGSAVTFVATGGGKYRWTSSSDTTASITKIINGSGNITQTVYVTTPHGAYKTLTKTVYVKPMPYTTINGNTSICKNDSARIILNPGTGTTFQWSNGATNDTIWVHPTTTSTYTAIVTNGNGCTNSLSATISIRNEPIVSISGDSVICKYNGTTLTATGGKNYFWSTGATTAQIHVVPTTNQVYSVYTRDSAGCYSDTSSIMIQVITPQQIEITGDQNICRGDTSVLAINNNSFSYNWNTGDTTSSILVQPPSSTIYSALAMDPTNGCIATDTAIVSVNSGVNNGQICVYYIPNCTPFLALVAKYSSGTYYLWSTGETSTSIEVPAAPGTYSLTISNHDGCEEKHLSVTIDSSICGCNSPNISGNATICLGGSTTLTANTYANPQPTGYIWSNGATTRSITVSPTTSTTYSVQMLLDSCIQTVSFTVEILQDTIAPIIGIDTICTNNSYGRGINTLNNGLTYLWSNGATTSYCFPNVGNQYYYVTITYPGGCTITGSKYITEIPHLSFSVLGDSSVCANDSILLIGSDNSLSYWWYGLGNQISNDSAYIHANISGSIQVNATNSTSTTFCSSTINYPIHLIENDTMQIIGNTIVCSGSSVTYSTNYNGTVLWSNGSTSHTITITPANNQLLTCIGTSSCGDISIDTVFLTVISNQQQNNYNLDYCSSTSPVFIHPKLNGSYTWNNGQNSDSVSVIPIQDTTVYVDILINGGCVVREIYHVHVLPLPSISFTAIDSICQGENVQITVSGATTYLWENGYQTNYIVEHPQVDTWYSVTGTNGYGCTTNDSIFIHVNEKPIFYIYGPSYSCGNQGAYLSAVLNYSNAPFSYSYLWSNGGKQQVIYPTINSDTAYSVIVTTSYGCSATDTKIISTQLPTPVISGNELLCKGKSVNLSVANNNYPSGTTYLWSNGSTQSGINVSPAQSTIYTVTVTWPGGCATTATKNITVDSIPAITFTGNNQLCKGGTTTIKSFGGSNPYWNSFGFKDSIVVSPTTTTTYQVQVSNANGCTRTGSYTVNVINSPVTFTGDSTMCVNASINLTASGGTSYNWNTGATSNSITVSPSQYSNYSVTITNGNTCSASHTFPIYILTTPTASISGDLFACENETTILTASLGNNYLWSTGDTTRSITIPPNTATSSYSVSVYGANGCIANTATIHHLIPPPSITVNGSTSRCGAGSLFLNAYQSGATYLWSTGSTYSSINYIANSSSNITLTITNNYGCTNDTTIAITVNEPPTPIISSSTTNLCDGDSILLTCNLNNVTYSWSNQDTTIGTYVNQQGNYNVFCTDNNGCTGISNTLQITNVSSPPPVLSSLADTICNGDSVNIIATGANQYQWSPSVNISNASSNTPIFYPTTSTAYTLTGTNLYGCMSSTTYSITVNQLPIVNAGTDTSINNGNSLQLGGNPTSTGLGPFTYLWTPGINLNDSLMSNPTLLPDTTSYYYVTTTDGNGCTNRDSILVTVTNLQGLNNNEIISTISLTPNPASNSITIKINSETTGAFEIRVFNASGQVILDFLEEKSLIQLEKNINIATWDSGVYYLQVKNSNWDKTIRFIKVE